MRVRQTVRNWVLAPLAIVLASSAMVGSASGADSVAGSQGIDTSLPLTDSAATVTGRGDFADLKVTVNQTKDLSDQVISLTWEGGKPTRSAAGRFGAQYLQIMQCWGEDDGTVLENPGPPPEQCVQGAVAGTYGGLPGSLYPAGFALTRIISRSTWGNFDPNVGFLDERTTNVWRSFKAVDGTVVNAHTDPNFDPALGGGNFWQNQFFDVITTNEIPGGISKSNGTGGELFQVLTGVQSSGLGCGQRVLRVNGSAPTIPKCWLVIVPRGEPSQENAGTPFNADAELSGVVTSPLSPAAWANRIAIPLEFVPVDSPCRLGDDERQITGNELAFRAVVSWQPVLCTSNGLPPFSYAPVGDQLARQQLVSPRVGSPGLVAVSRPIPSVQVRAENPIVYAPLVASGIAIAFNIERVPKPTAPDDAQNLSGVRVAEMNMTPRLVAKLLTQSYGVAVRILKSPDYPWLASNPALLGLDPDFLRFNPEFTLLGNSDRNFSSLTMPAGNSDAAQQVWEWVLNDPEARAWLDGAPDEWGMKVNPVYSTNPSVNPAGLSFAAPAPQSFPKADPYCYQAPLTGAGGTIKPPPLCGTDWVPYARSFDEAALMTRAAYDRARIVPRPTALTISDAWARSEPQFLGSRVFLSVTDTGSIGRYGLQAARLSRSGDNRPDRSFVGPDDAGLRSGVESMRPQSGSTVRQPSVLEQPASAYPLSTLTYAAVAPLAIDSEKRADLASFVRYGVTEGQQPGKKLGQLPSGYLPLPDDLRAEALSVADQIVNLKAPTATPTTTSTTPLTPTAAPTPTPTPTPESAATPAPAVPFIVAAPERERRTSTVSSAPTAATELDVTPEVIVPSDTVAPAEAEVKEEDEVASVAGKKLFTPSMSGSAGRFAVPALGGLSLITALVALELTKRPRRLDGGDSGVSTPNTGLTP